MERQWVCCCCNNKTVVDKLKTNTKHIEKIGLFVVLVLFVVGFSFGESYGAAFVKFDGIDGESKDKEHKDWINLLSVTMTQDNSNVIQFTKTLDHSSAAISQSAISGNVHERAMLDVCLDREECQRYDLQNVRFTGYFMKAAGDQRPTEEITLVYAKISKSNSRESAEKTAIEPSPPQRPTGDVPAKEIVQVRVPSWVQTTATFWVDGDVSDKEFTDGIGYLVREMIIEIEPVQDMASGQPAEPEVPSWIKQNTKWWIDGQVPEDQFLDSIKWLIQNNIITGVSN
jgi:type VI protein secretion system component Hcp